MLCRAGGRFALSTPFQSDVLSPKIPTKGGGIMEREWLQSQEEVGKTKHPKELLEKI